MRELYERFRIYIGWPTGRHIRDEMLLAFLSEGAMTAPDLHRHLKRWGVILSTWNLDQLYGNLRRLEAEGLVFRYPSPNPKIPGYKIHHYEITAKGVEHVEARA